MIELGRGGERGWALETTQGIPSFAPSVETSSVETAYRGLNFTGLCRAYINSSNGALFKDGQWYCSLGGGGGFLEPIDFDWMCRFAYGDNYQGEQLHVYPFGYQQRANDPDSWECRDTWLPRRLDDDFIPGTLFPVGPINVFVPAVINPDLLGVYPNPDLNGPIVGKMMVARYYAVKEIRGNWIEIIDEWGTSWTPIGNILQLVTNVSPVGGVLPMGQSQLTPEQLQALVDQAQVGTLYTSFDQIPYKNSIGSEAEMWGEVLDQGFLVFDLVDDSVASLLEAGVVSVSSGTMFSLACQVAGFVPTSDEVATAIEASCLLVDLTLGVVMAVGGNPIPLAVSLTVLWLKYGDDITRYIKKCVDSWVVQGWTTTNLCADSTQP